MKKHINKLLNSKNLPDILIGIELAYTLPFEDFKEIFREYRLTGYRELNYYIFKRENLFYAMGRGQLFLATPFDISNTWGVTWIDLTPKEYENSNK